MCLDETRGCGSVGRCEGLSVSDTVVGFRGVNVLVDKGVVER